jgi:hypothetical protein
MLPVMLRLCLFCPLSLLLCASLLAQSKYAQRDVESPRTLAWLERYDQGDRFEGSYTQDVSGGAVELVSLTGHMSRYAFRQGEQLQVHFYNPGESRYLLKLEELRTTNFYWGEWKATQPTRGWNRCGPWPVDEGLRRFSVSPANLAVLLRFGAEDEARYAPAYVGLDGQRPALHYYLLRFRLGRSILKGSYRVYRGERPSGTVLISQDLAPQSGGTLLDLRLMKSKLPPQPGWLTVKLNLEAQGNRDAITYTLSFYHQP